MGVLLILFIIIAAIVAFFIFDFEKLNQGNAYIAKATKMKSDILNILSQKGLARLNKNAININSLNCRIQSTIHREGNDVCNAFALEVCGTIHTPNDRHKAVIKVNIWDITDGMQKAQPVQAKIKQWQQEGSQNLNVISELGTLPNKNTVLSEWTSVASLRLDRILLPRMGKRVLKFNISILSAQNNMELASSECTYEHDNLYFGYIDLQENLKRSRTLTVALAFSVIAADGNLLDEEIEFIKNWARENINTSQTSETDKQKLEEALGETVAFFKDGNLLNTYDICTEIVEIVPVVQRYNILELCLNAVKVSGAVAEQELKTIRDIVNWMELSGKQFREMMERIIPLDMHETTDIETLLGVTSDMSEEKAREHLNKEYAKWNSRVTNSDPKIQSQADQMLKLIAEARTHLVKS